MNQSVLSKASTSDAAPALRLFCAVELPEEMKNRVGEYIAWLRRFEPQGQRGAVRWGRGEQLHITLKFFGAVAVERVEALESAAMRAGAASAPLSLEIVAAEPGVFPPHGSPRVLWLGLRDEEKRLARLQRRLEDECARENFPRAARPFHPHLTVARLHARARELTALHRTSTFETDAFAVDQFVVMQSTLGPAGSRYTVLSRHFLSGAEMEQTDSLEAAGPAAGEG